MAGDLDQRQVRRAFGRAATGYEQHAVLQREVEDRLIERLEYIKGAPLRILDVGCGPGRASGLLRKRHPNAQTIALDLALPMLQAAKRHAGWWRPFTRVCADAAALPFAQSSVDLLFSNLCLQWIEDLPGVFNEFRRVLKPGGFLAISTFGPNTLHELRSAWSAADNTPHVSRFADILEVGNALLAAGFRDPVLDSDRFTLTYADATTLMRELRAIGATNASVSRSRQLTGKEHYRRVLEAYEPFRREGNLPATYEVIYAHGFAPDGGQPRRDAGGEVATFPVSQLKVRRRT
jgi:malonyl-CoA O-methyltransferase